MTRRVYIVPAIVALLTLAGVLGADYISIPTLSHVFDKNPGGESATAVFTVYGVRCYGTADLLREHIGSLPGLVSMVAYAGKHRVIIEYCPGVIGPEDIISAVEKPILTDEGLMQYFDVISHENR